MLALNKQPGQIVQADKTGDPCMADELKNYIKQRDGKPGNVFCGVVHRIDRPVSGVVLFAKTSKALSRMNELIKNRDIRKTYLAVVGQKPPQEEDDLEDFLVRDERNNKSRVVCNPHQDGAKQALLHYKLLGTSTGGYHLLEVQLYTGRHHQIRCQLAHIGCPIKGDLKYGAPRSNPDGSISLHAYRMEFEHPVRHTPLILTAPIPWPIFSDLTLNL